jgi:hypothetical protein
MFLIIGEKLLPWLSVRSKATDDTLHALRKNALLFRPLVFDRSGVSSIFQYQGADRKNQTIQYVYDALYRLTHKGYPDSTGVDYIYDLAGQGAAGERSDRDVRVCL